MAISNLLSGTQGNYKDWTSKFKTKTTTPQMKTGVQTPVPASMLQSKMPTKGVVTPPKQQAVQSNPQLSPATAGGTVGTQNQVYTAPTHSAGQQMSGVLQQKPLTGNAPTINGATVNTATGQLVSQAPQYGSRGLFTDVTSSLANRGAHVDPMTQESYRRAQGLAETLKQSRENQARSEASQRLAPIPIGDATGRQAVIRQQYETQQAALTGQLQAEQALAGLGIQQSGVQQSALGTAAGLAQPQLGQFGQGYYNPLDPTGGAAGAGGGQLNPLNNVDAIAQQVINGQLSPSQAYSMGGTIANWQTLLNQKITGLRPDFNVAQAQARYDATQQAGTIAGIAPTQAFASAYQTYYPQQLQIQGAMQNVQNLGNLVFEVAGKEVNPFDLTYANDTLARFRSRLSSPQQAQFNQALSTYASALSGLLAESSSVTPTQVTSWTNGILDGTLKLDALKASYQQALKEGTIKLQTAQALTNQAGGNIGAPQVGGNSNPLGI